MEDAAEPEHTAQPELTARPDRTDCRYEAFISYRHASTDIATAKRVQRALEGFRIPNELRDEAGRKRLGKLFRDEDELAASASLSDTIARALEQSRYLIVICTPAAAASEWMSREIEEFSRTHGRDRILTVLAEGEPETSFPAPLRIGAFGSEPLAADLRPGKTRKQQRAEVLRLAAALIGCSYDSLAKRERERMGRLITRASAAAAAIGIAFGGFSYWQQAQIEKNYRAMQINQSEYLATEALDLVDQGKRMEAIQVALAALPESESDGERPLVNSAQHALSEALGVYPSPPYAGASGSWRAEYSVSDMRTLNKMAVSEYGGWYAIPVSDEAIRVFDLETGLSHDIAPVKMPDDPQHWVGFASYDAPLIATENTLIAFVSYDTVTSYDAKTGEVAWQYRANDHLVIAGAATSQNNNILAVFSYDPSGTEAEVYLLETETGKELARIPFSAAGTFNAPIAVTPSGSHVAVGVDGAIYAIDTATGNVTTASANNPLITSICASERGFYAISTPQAEVAFSSGGSTAYSSEDFSNPATSATVEAFDWNADSPLWKKNASWNAYQSNLSATSFYVSPKIREIFSAGELEDICVTFNEQAYTLDGITGNTLGVATYSSPIVETYYYVGKEDITGFAITYEGEQYRTSIFGNNAQTQLMSLNTNDCLWQAKRVQYDGETYFIGCSAESLNKATVYRMEPNENLRNYRSMLDGNSIGTPNCDGSLCVAWNGDEETLVTTDTETGEQINTVHYPDLSITLPNAENVTFAASESDPSVYYFLDKQGADYRPAIWKIDVETGELLASWKWNGETDNEYPEARRISQEVNGYFTVTHTNLTAIVDAETLNEVHSSPVSLSSGFNVPACGDAVLCGSKIISLDNSAGAVRLLDASTIQPIEAFENVTVDMSNTLTLNGKVACSPDESRFVIAEADGKLHAYETSSGNELWAVDFDSTNAVFLRFTPDGQHVFAQDSTSTCSVIDAATGSSIRAQETEQLTALSVRFSQDGSLAYVRAYSLSFLEHTLVFNIENGTCELLAHIPLGHIVTKDESHVVCVDQNGTFSLPLYTLDELVGIARETIRGHELTDAQKRLYHIG